MKNVESHNDEDAKVWSVLESFNFDGFDTSSQIRVALYKRLIEAMGYCGMCQHFIKNQRRCKMLEFSTGVMDRCCDFEKVLTEGNTAFDIMSENFVEEQSQRIDATRINKYTHCSNKNDQAKPKDEVEPEGEE